ncbi:MAG: MFS transporter [Pseudomonadales bacterium]|nr:MFS transporter [Pseudomonadales bacterium]
MNPPYESPRALNYANFRSYLFARFFTTVAVQMQSVAIGWQVYAATGDPLDLGLIGLAQFLPFVLLVLPAGQVADKLNRRTILALCYLAELVCALLLLAFTLSGLQEVWPVFAVLVLFGSARAFSMPASDAITPNLVPRVAFPNAIALNSSFGHIGTIAGPALGGILYIAGPDTVYGTVGAILMLSVIMMLRVQLPATIRSTEPSTLHTVLEGLRFVRSKPVILGAISLDLFAVLFGGATALLPAFASDILHTGPEGLGLLRTAPALGAAAVAILLGFFPINRHVGRWLFGGVAIFGVAIIVFGMSEHFYLSLAALTMLGAGDMISVYIRHLLVQLETPDEIRGRVSAVNAVFIGASNELGEFESGVTAAWFGVVRSVIIGGTATLIVTGLWIRLFPQLANMDELPKGIRE